MIDGRSLTNLGERDVGDVAELVLNLTAEVAALTARVAALEAAAQPHGNRPGDDVDAVLGRVLPTRGS